MNEKFVFPVTAKCLQDEKYHELYVHMSADKIEIMLCDNSSNATECIKCRNYILNKAVTDYKEIISEKVTYYPS